MVDNMSSSKLALQNNLNIWVIFFNPPNYFICIQFCQQVKEILKKTQKWSEKQKDKHYKTGENPWTLE